MFCEESKGSLLSDNGINHLRGGTNKLTPDVVADSVDRGAEQLSDFLAGSCSCLHLHVVLPAVHQLLFKLWRLSVGKSVRWKYSCVERAPAH